MLGKQKLDRRKSIIPPLGLWMKSNKPSASTPSTSVAQKQLQQHKKKNASTDRGRFGTFNWGDIMRSAVKEQQKSQVSSDDVGVLRQGSWLVEDGAVVHWYIDTASINIVDVFPNGRNKKFAVAHVDILEMELLDYDDEERENQAALALEPKKTLRLMYKSWQNASVDVLLIPNFGIEAEFFLAHSLWNRSLKASSNAAAVASDGFTVIKKGTRRVDNGNVLTWAFSLKSFSFCFLNSSLHSVRLSHICDLTFEALADGEDLGSLTVSYVAFDNNNDQMKQSGVKTLSIVEKKLKLAEFGSGLDFEEVCLRWRQELQLQLIDDVFGAPTHETILSQYAKKVRHGEKPSAVVRFDVPDDSSVAPEDNSKRMIVKRAQSMRRVCKDMRPSEKGYPTPAPSPLSADFSAAMEIFLNEPTSPALEKLPEAEGRNLEDNDNLSASPKRESGVQTETTTNHIRGRSNSQPLDLIDNILEDLQNLNVEKSFSRRRFTDTFDNKLTVRTPAESPILETIPKLPDVYIASYNYLEPGPGEMRMEKNDRMRVVKQDNSGWWYALKLEYRQDDEKRWVVTEEGWVPSNYLKSSTHAGVELSS